MSRELHAAVAALSDAELLDLARVAGRSTAPDVRTWLLEVVRLAARGGNRATTMGTGPHCPDCGIPLECGCQRNDGCAC